MRNFVVIHGLAPSYMLGYGDNSDPAMREYISKIVYGTPSRIFCTLLASGKFVALVEWTDARTHAAATFQRMSSFSYGSQLFGTDDVATAFSEFGTWIGHYSGHRNAEGVDV